MLPSRRMSSVWILAPWQVLIRPLTTMTVVVDAWQSARGGFSNHRWKAWDVPFLSLFQQKSLVGPQQNDRMHSHYGGFHFRLFSNQSGRDNNKNSDDGDDDDDDDGDDIDVNWKIPTNFNIPEERLAMSFVRSGGAGGQNVNKVNTQVQLRLKLDADTCGDWIPDEVRARLSQQQQNRINKQDELIVQMSQFRTQIQNKKAAVDKLRDLILQAWPRPKQRKLRKGVSAETKERYKKEKIFKSEKKKSRGRIDF